MPVRFTSSHPAIRGPLLRDLISRASLCDMRQLTSWYAALIVAAVPLNAQSATGVSAVDSAAAARLAWGRGVRALNAGDLITASAEISRAALAWPTQSSYVWGKAYTAALAGDTSEVIASLDRYAAYGLGRSLRGDSAFMPYRGPARFDRAAGRVEGNLTPKVHSRAIATLPDSTFWPEGVDYDARTKRFYVASVRHRTVAELSPDGTVRELWPREQAGMGAVLGVRVDRAVHVSAAIERRYARAHRESALPVTARCRANGGWTLGVHR